MPLNHVIKDGNKNNCKGKLLYFFYNVLWLVILLPVSILILWRYRKYPAHNKRFSERLGLSSSKKLSNKNIWLHTASVGEVNAALPLLHKLIKQYSADSILVTTTTPTGEQVLINAFNGSVDHLYLPFDQCFLMKRFLSRVNPHVVILFETEVWPSLIVEAKNNNAEVVLVNARMSGKSKNKYLQFKPFSNYIFSRLSLIVAQTKEDAHRFYELGVPDCQISGSLKYSIAVDEELLEHSKIKKTKWLAATGNKKIIIAASTHPVEEDLILDAFLKIKDVYEALLILVPRHVERSDEVKALCIKQGFSIERFGDEKIPAANVDIVLVDVVGKLFNLFGLADVAIMGGTFISRGGHNFLEPAAWGLPIISGKSDYNFSEISRGLKESNALTQVSDAQSLADILGELLSSDFLAKEQGDNAKKYSQRNSDVVNKMFSIIEPILPKKAS